MLHASYDGVAAFPNRANRMPRDYPELFAINAQVNLAVRVDVARAINRLELLCIALMQR